MRIINWDEKGPQIVSNNAGPLDIHNAVADAVGEPKALAAAIAELVNHVTEPSEYGSLCDEYALWNKANGLNLGSADEHLFDDTLTAAQREWLSDFCRRWELVGENLRALSDAERDAYKDALK